MDKLLLLIRLSRPTEWIKNIFLFVPLFFTPRLLHIPQITSVFLGFILFSVLASSIYALNDLKDAAADRLHPFKKNRPIASGKITDFTAQLFCVALAVIGFTGSFLLSQTFFLVVLIYYVINLAYCYGLKNIAIIDIYCISAGFILRVTAGAVLIDVTPSIWILMCTGLLALFLALAKRRDDLVLNVNHEHRDSICGYNIAFVDICIAIVLSALFIDYTVYTTLDTAEIHLGTTHFYWTVPVVLLGILRYLQLTFVEKRSGSPAVLLMTDQFLLSTVIAWIILSAILMY